MIETPNKILTRTILHAKPHDYRIIMPTLIMSYVWNFGGYIADFFPPYDRECPSLRKGVWLGLGKMVPGRAGGGGGTKIWEIQILPEL